MTHLHRWGSTGHTFLLLHGLPVDGRLWQAVGQRIEAAGHTALAPDLPGYGATPDLRDQDLQAHRAWLDGLLDTLPGPLHLVGHDYGGLLAADAAVRRGAASLTLSSTLVGLAWAPIKATALPGAERFFYRRYGGRRWLAAGVRAPARDTLVQQYATQLQDPALPQRMRATAAGIPLRHCATLAGRLRRSRVPVTCIWGRRDRGIPWPLGWWTARSTGGCLVSLPKARHYVMVEQAEGFAEALLAGVD